MNTSQLPALEELSISALRLLHPLREGGAEHSSAPMRGTPGGCCSSVGIAVSGHFGDLGSSEGRRRPAARGRPTGGGAGEAPGAERGRRGRSGGRRRRSAALAGRGGTSGPAGKLPD